VSLVVRAEKTKAAKKITRAALQEKGSGHTTWVRPKTWGEENRRGTKLPTRSRLNILKSGEEKKKGSTDPEGEPNRRKREGLLSSTRLKEKNLRAHLPTLRTAERNLKS